MTKPNLSPELAQRIQNHAQQALDLGAITGEQFAALTDGNITKQDHAIAGGAYGRAFSQLQTAGRLPAGERERINQVADATHQLWVATSQVDTRSGAEKIADSIGEAAERLNFTFQMWRLRAFGP